MGCYHFPALSVDIVFCSIGATSILAGYICGHDGFLSDWKFSPLEEITQRDESGNRHRKYGNIVSVAQTQQLEADSLWCAEREGVKARRTRR